SRSGRRRVLLGCAASGRGRPCEHGQGGGEEECCPDTHMRPAVGTAYPRSVFRRVHDSCPSALRDSFPRRSLSLLFRVPLLSGFPPRTGVDSNNHCMPGEPEKSQARGRRHYLRLAWPSDHCPASPESGKPVMANRLLIPCVLFLAALTGHVRGG